MGILKPFAKGRSNSKINRHVCKPGYAQILKVLWHPLRLTCTAVQGTWPHPSSEGTLTQEPELDYVEAATCVLMIHRAKRPGNILLFLMGEE